MRVFPLAGTTAIRRSYLKTDGGRGLSSGGVATREVDDVAAREEVVVDASTTEIAETLATTPATQIDEESPPIVAPPPAQSSSLSSLVESTVSSGPTGIFSSSEVGAAFTLEALDDAAMPAKSSPWRKIVNAALTGDRLAISRNSEREPPTPIAPKQREDAATPAPLVTSSSL